MMQALRRTFLAAVLLTPYTGELPAGFMDGAENRYDPGPPRNLVPPGARSHVVLLGSGMPLPNPYRFGPATAVIVNGTPYIVDAGEGIWRALGRASALHGGKVAAAFVPNRLTRLFITHQHADHTIGIPAFLMMPWYMGRTKSVEIWGPKGIVHTVNAIQDAFSIDVNERIRIQIPPEKGVGYRATAHDLDIETSAIVYEDDNVKVEAFHHHHVGLKHAFAYRFTTPDRIIVIGGDGTADERLVAAAQDADVFIMEVATEADLANAPWGGNSLAKKEKVMWAYHIKPRELAEIATKAQVRLLVLYHVQNYSDPFDGEALLKEIRQFYRGDVVQGRDSDIY